MRKEIATLVVNGRKFRDWKTVRVQHRWNEGSHIFDFTCSEKHPAPIVLALLDAFKPGDEVQIFLADNLAITGEITVRQVAYDDQTHGVQLIGKTWSHLATKSSMEPKSSNFDGYSWEQIARAALAKIGVGLQVRGTLDPTPFENMQAQPGELTFSFLERIARMRGIVLGSTQHGDVIAIGEHAMATTDSLVEGQNIKRASCVFSNEWVHRRYLVTAQTTGNDGRRGAAASEIEVEAPGTLPRPSLSVIPSEHSSTLPEALIRARFEAQWAAATELEATITVQGWLRKNGDLWRVGEAVHVRSPMLSLDMPLAIRTAVFTQDNGGGTQTQLNLVPPWLLNGRVQLLPNSTMPQPPGPANPTE